MFGAYMGGCYCEPWCVPFGAYTAYAGGRTQTQLLEQYQRDLEQQLADVASELQRLKGDRPPEPAHT